MIGILRNLIARHVTPRLTARLQSAESAWNRFWFTPTDPFLLGVMRILTGAMLVYNLAVWTLDLEAFFGSHGLQPLETVRRLHSSRLVFSFWTWIDDTWLWPVHFVCLGIAMLFCAGVFTRVTSVFGFLIAISYSQRVPVANFGLDQILGILCLYLAIGPSGAAMSFDAWLRSRRRSASGDHNVTKLASATVATRLIQLHWCAIYFWAGHAKLKGETWWTGEAMWNVLANQEYQTLDLTWLAHMPWVPWLAAHITILWETFYPVLIWNARLRPLMLSIGVAMHVGIGAFLGMWTFGLIMTFAYLAYLDPAYWRGQWGRFAPRPGQRDQHDDVAGKSSVESDSEKLAAAAGVVEVQDELNTRQRIMLLGPESLDRESVRKYLYEHGYDCTAVDDLSSLSAIKHRDDITVTVVQATRMTAAEASELVELFSKRHIPIVMLLPEKLQPLAASVGDPDSVAWIPLPASLKQIRLAVERLCSTARVPFEGCPSFQGSSPGTPARRDPRVSSLAD